MQAEFDQSGDAEVAAAREPGRDSVAMGAAILPRKPSRCLIDHRRRLSARLPSVARRPVSRSKRRLP